MATNPMKRREHNAFFIGIIIGLILVLLVGFIMYKLYSDVRKEYESYRKGQEDKEITVVLAAKDIKSGTKLSEDDFVLETVIVPMDTEECYLSIYDIFGEDYTPDEDKDDDESEDKSEEQNVEEDDSNAILARLDIPEGAVITKNLLESKADAISDDTRVQEYSSIVLPSHLEVGDIIDVRLTMPNGQDFVVLSKKEVLRTDATTVWLNVNEAEIQIMNSAMVEAWTITGTKFYAIEYVDAGMQASAYVTYQPTYEVASLILSTPNVVKEAKAELEKQWRASEASSFRENELNGMLKQYVDDRDGAVESGFSNDSATIKQHRTEFIDSLGE